MSKTEQLLRQTARRQMLAVVGQRFHQGVLGGAALFLALLLVSRLLGLIPNGFTPLSLVAVPGAALVLALALMRQPASRAVARLIDARAGGKELFLTAAMIGESPGEFQSIVVAQAEERAAQIAASEVIPFRWQRGAAHVALALALLFAAIHFLPQLDPFKKAEQRNKIAQQEQQLQELKKITALRSEALSQQTASEAEQVRQALAALDKTFKEAKPLEKESTLKQLAAEQRELGELWRKVNNDQLKKALDKTAQSFGQLDAKKLGEWREELKKGDLTGLKKELSEMREQMKQLAAQPDSAEKRAQREQLAQRLNQFAEAMKQTANSPQLSEALSRAQTQLDLSKLSQLSPEATQSAMDSMQLSEQELEQLAQALQDSKALGEALKNLQMARQLAGQGELSGEACKNANGMSEYAVLFAKKMSELGDTPDDGGSGLGPGRGNGAKRPEDDSTQSAFKTEKSSSALAGGKLLLEWKTKEVGETGARTEEVAKTLHEVKQGVSEAIQQEQVPPGYHDAIKRYFDTLAEGKTK